MKLLVDFDLRIDQLQEIEIQKKELIQKTKRLEEENVWLKGQLVLARRVGQEMEQLVSCRVDLYKPEGITTDLGERIHNLHLQNTKLEQEKLDLIQKLDHVSLHSSNIIQDWKSKCNLFFTKDLNELSVSKSLFEVINRDRNDKILGSDRQRTHCNIKNDVEKHGGGEVLSLDSEIKALELMLE